MAILHPLLKRVFPGQGAGSLSVLSFHRIPEQDLSAEPREFDIGEFERLLDILEEDFRVLPLFDGLRALSKSSLPDCAVALTFDDGYADWRNGVVPALRQRNMHATFFIACGQLSGQLLWYDRFRSLLRAGVSFESMERVFGDIVGAEVWALPEHDRPFVLERVLKYAARERREAVLAELESIVGSANVGDESLVESDIRTFHSMGFDIGAHTFTHPILAACSDDEAWREIADSRDYLSGLLSARVNGFAYPNGKPEQDFTAAHAEMVRKAGYDYAVSTARGVATADTPRFAVPRFGPWRNGRFALARHLAMNRFESVRPDSAFGASITQGFEPAQSGARDMAQPKAMPLTNTLPSVSVVIPVFNCHDLLAEALESVLAQEIPVEEIIVINDGSTDGDYQHYARTYPGVRVIDKDNEGVSASRNLGIREARGEIIAFLDADDVWLPGKLAAQLRVFAENPDVGVVFGRFEKWFPDTDGTYRAWRSFGEVTIPASIDPDRSGWLFGKLAMGLLVGMNTATVRKSIFEELGGFDPSRHIGEDYELWLRISRHTQMACIGSVVALYRMRAGSAMSALRERSEMVGLLEEARARWGLTAPNCSGLTESAFRRRMAQAHFEHGYNHFWRGSHQIAHAAFRDSLKYQPRQTKVGVYALVSRLSLASQLIRNLSGRK